MENTERIRARAHEIWETEGRPQGRDVEHWTQAEQELAASETGPDPDAAPQLGDETGGDAPAASAPEAGPTLQQGTNAPGPRG